MPSRGELRTRLEAGLRAVAVAALAWAAWRAAEAASRGAERPAARLTASSLGVDLPRLTTRPPRAVHVDAERLPDDAQRSWLAALARAGTGVTWSAGDSVLPFAASHEPVAAPAPASRFRVLGDAPWAIVSDAVGVVDSLAARGAAEGKGPPRLRATLQAATSGAVRLSVPWGTAGVAARDSVVLRPVLVVGAASWEAKFTVAALEEAGWRVVTRLTVSPDAVVTQGDAAQPDTARYAALVLLDSAAGPSPSLVRQFAERGGGVVVAGSAVRRPAYAALAAASAGARVRGEPGALETTDPRRGLSGNALTVSARGVAVLERRGAAPVVVGRRLGAGRVVAVGYDESWRWRLEGGETSPADHRAWWSSLVASVAHAPPATRGSGGRPPHSGFDGAPFAATVAALGAPQPAPAAATTGTRLPVDALLFAAALLALLGEWCSRRTRGAR
jgi:hypothetical protein